jgi:tetratricopeptide (TPR) repeat protein
MRRSAFWSLVLVCLFAARGAAAQDPFHAERHAALQQVAWVEQAYAERLGPHGADWRARIKKEEPALVSTLDWLSRNAEGDQALRLAVPLAYFWTYDGRASESRDLLSKVIALPSAAAPTALRAKALYDAGALAYADRDQSAARALGDESLRISRKLQDNTGVATALLGLARVALRDMDYATVRRYAEESGVIRRDLGDKVGQAGAVHVLAAVARIQGQYDKAVELYQFSLDANRDAGWDLPVAAELFNLGYVRLRQGKAGDAKKLFTDSLQKYRDLQDEMGVAYVLTGFASVAVEQRQAARAARLYAAGLGILDRFGVTFDPDDQLDIDHYTAKLLTQLPPGAFNAASAEGRTTSSERAIALALAP